MMYPINRVAEKTLGSPMSKNTSLKVNSVCILQWKPSFYIIADIIDGVVIVVVI